MPVKLLVSVRSPEEAFSALEGGADIIDIKEPTEGPLGRADAGVISRITRLVRRKAPATIVSAALGEVAESTASESIVLNGESPPDLVKSGLSGLNQNHGSWQNRWQVFRETAVVTQPQTQWVAVAYADDRRSGSPPASDVLEEGHRIGCPFFLIDTFQKDGTSLVDWISIAELDRIRCRTREYGMKLALAGQVTIAVLPRILTVDPDIIAVRGAVCADGDRGATVTAGRVRDLVASLRLVTPLTAAE